MAAPRSRVAVVVVGGSEPAPQVAGASGAPLIQVVGQAPAGTQARALVARVKPDIVLLHVDRADTDVGALIDGLQAEHPTARIVVVDGNARPRAVGANSAGATGGMAGGNGASTAGPGVAEPGAAPGPAGTAAGVIVTDGAFVDVVAGIRTAMASGPRSSPPDWAPAEAPEASAIVAPGVVTAVRSNGSRPSLTRREHEILRLVALGHTNNEIALRLGLAANTVKTYWQRALHKLSARNRAEAIARAHEMHLI
ncbi:MAG TPA: response regulator transcription factor [Acidimicrobiales bacterium]|nr:response regulator transcription factor [Acidimicrobiales bacterium]